jgi:hypothetical protein
VDVIRHQDIRHDAPAKPLRGLAEELEERTPIAIGAEDRTPLIAARGDVVNGSGKVETKWSCHDSAEVPSESAARRGTLAGVDGHWQMTEKDGLLHYEKRYIA